MVKKPHGKTGRKEYRLYHPQSVTDALLRESIGSYQYHKKDHDFGNLLDLTVEGLKEAVTVLLAGGPVHMKRNSFCDNRKDASALGFLFTFLVHLGYLAYDMDADTVWIPNREIMEEFLDSAGRYEKYSEVCSIMNRSHELCRAIELEDAMFISERIKNACSCVSFMRERHPEWWGYLACQLALYGITDHYQLYAIKSNNGMEDTVVFLLPKAGSGDCCQMVISLSDKKLYRYITDWTDTAPEECEDAFGPVLWLCMEYDDRGSFYCTFNEGFWED